MAATYLGAQVPRYPASLADFRPPPPNMSAMMTDAVMFEGVPQKRPMAGADMFGEGIPAAPYSNPYTAQADAQRRQQMSLGDMKRAYDIYNKFGAAAPASGSYYIGGPAGSLTADGALAGYGGPGVAAPASIDIGGPGMMSGSLMAVPGGSGFGTAAGGAAFDAGVAAVPGGLSNAAVGSAASPGFFGSLFGGGEAAAGAAGAAGAGTMGTAAMAAGPLALFLLPFMFAMNKAYGDG